jgi:hypothetical protein
MGIVARTALPELADIRTNYPLDAHSAARVAEGRHQAERILNGSDGRALCIVGPCSAWPSEAVLTYAERLAPLARDWMVIETPPDIVHFGHAHHNAVDNYRGVQIINSGTFQSQTEFMRKQGIIPTPGIVTIINLHSGQPVLKFFADYSNQAYITAS